MADTGSTYTNNGAIDGGALFIEQSKSIYLTTVIFTSNQAISGGAMELRSESELTLGRALAFTTNKAYMRGGCISAKSLSSGNIILSTL